MELGGDVDGGDLNLNPSSTIYYFLASDCGFLIYKTETINLPCVFMVKTGDNKCGGLSTLLGTN